MGVIVGTAIKPRGRQLDTCRSAPPDYESLELRLAWGLPISESGGLVQARKGTHCELVGDPVLAAKWSGSRSPLPAAQATH